MKRKSLFISVIASGIIASFSLTSCGMAKDQSTITSYESSISEGSSYVSDGGSSYSSYSPNTSESSSPSSSISSNQGDIVKVYKKIKAASDIAFDKKVVIVAPYSGSTGYYAMTNAAKSETLPWYVVGAEVEIDSNDEIEQGEFAEWDISFADGYYSFKNGNNYLQSYVDGSHYSINIGSNSSYSDKWQLTFNGDGTATYKSDVGVYLEYYKGSFCGYSKSVSAYLFQENGERESSKPSTPVVIDPDDIEDSKWSGLNFSTYGETFRNTLADLINKTNTAGTTSYSSCLNIGAKAAAYPSESSSTFIPFYHEAKTSEQTTTSSCNREHTWPNSRGGGSIETDPIVIRPTLTKDNSSRGNNFYGNTKSNEWDPSSCGYEGARGESARIILYAACRYYGKGLSLSNNPSDSTSSKTMGTLKTLLEWNRKYAPTDFEKTVNDRYDKMGYARNPFVDHPGYADFIWDDNGLRKSAPTVA